MPRFINTYSRLRPVFKKAEIDEFSELQRFADAHRKKKVAALKSIAENETDDQDEDNNMAETFHSKAMMNRMSKPIPQKSSRRKPTPLKIQGKGVGLRHYSPMATSNLGEDTSDEIDESILYLSDSTEEDTTLSDADHTLTNAETCEDSENQYSDIELPRDLPEPKRKSSTSASRILKLSQMSNKNIRSYLKSQKKGTRKVEKPAHSTLLDGKFSAMNIDQFGISDISGNGPQYCSSDSSSSYSLLEQDSTMPIGKQRRSPSKMSSEKKGGQKLSENGKKAQTTGRSVYSLLSNESNTSLTGSPSKKKGNEPKLKIAGKKVPLVKKSPTKMTQPHHDSIDELSAKGEQYIVLMRLPWGDKKQVSFQLKTKPEVFDPADPSMTTPFNVYLPHCSPSNSILKKKADIEPKDTANIAPTDTACGKANRATSTPQKSSRHSSRKIHGYHIMDLSFDVSAVSLPLDNDLVITHKRMARDEVRDMKQDRKSGRHTHGEATKHLLDFEPICLQASQTMGSLLETTPDKDKRKKRNELTPSTQMKRHSPDAGTPSKLLPKKSRILKPSGDAGLSNRKRLNYQQLSEPTPECVITKLPFPGYRLHPSIEQNPPSQGPVNIKAIREHPQGKDIPHILKFYR